MQLLVLTLPLGNARPTILKRLEGPGFSRLPGERKGRRPLAPKPAALKLTCNPAGPHFPITEQCQMPTITATAELENATLDPAVAVQYEWQVTLVFHRHGCIHAPDRVLKHDDIRRTTTTNSFKFHLRRSAEEA